MKVLYNKKNVFFSLLLKFVEIRLKFRYLFWINCLENRSDDVSSLFSFEKKRDNLCSTFFVWTNKSPLKTVISNMDPYWLLIFINLVILTNRTVCTLCISIIIIIRKWHYNAFSWIRKASRKRAPIQVFFVEKKVDRTFFLSNFKCSFI